jgi:hypothetical protein
MNGLALNDLMMLKAHCGKVLIHCYHIDME